MGSEPSRPLHDCSSAKSHYQADYPQLAADFDSLAEDLSSINNTRSTTVRPPWNCAPKCDRSVEALGTSFVDNVLIPTQAFCTYTSTFPW